MGWLIILPVSLVFVSEKISLVGIYHELKSPATPTGESLQNKIIAITKCNFNLTYPFAASYFVVIRATIDGIDTNNASILSLLVTLVTLVTIRVIANPCEYIKPNVCKFYNSNREKDLIDLHKERVLSCFYSFICTSIILGMIVFSYNLLMNIKIPLGTFNLFNFMTIALSYLIFLFIATLIGELILKYCTPLRRV